MLLLIAAENEATRAQREGFESRLAQAQVTEFEFAGHMLNWDRPERFNELVERFILSVS